MENLLNPKTKTSAAYSMTFDETKDNDYDRHFNSTSQKRVKLS